MYELDSDPSMDEAEILNPITCHLNRKNEEKKNTFKDLRSFKFMDNHDTKRVIDPEIWKI